MIVIALSELPQARPLVAVEALSYEEPARALGMPIAAVMSWLSRGRERMRRHRCGDLNGNGNCDR